MTKKQKHLLQVIDSPVSIDLAEAAKRAMDLMSMEMIPSCYIYNTDFCGIEEQQEGDSERELDE